ncbi:chalcone isomerase [Tanacetum coccineum]
MNLTIGPFEKLIHVNVLVPLTGKHFAEKTSQMMVQMWKDDGTYTDLDATTVDKYLEVFKDETLIPVGSSVLFTFLPDGSLMTCMNTTVTNHSTKVKSPKPLTFYLNDVKSETKK